MTNNTNNKRKGTIRVVEIYPREIPDLTERELQFYRERYNDGPCLFEVYFPWKKKANRMVTWDIESVRAAYGGTCDFVYENIYGERTEKADS